MSAFGQPLPSAGRAAPWDSLVMSWPPHKLPDCLHVLAEGAQEWMGNSEEGFGKSATSTEVTFILIYVILCFPSVQQMKQAAGNE